MKISLKKNGKKQSLSDQLKDRFEITKPSVNLELQSFQSNAAINNEIVDSTPNVDYFRNLLSIPSNYSVPSRPTIKQLQVFFF